VEQLSKGNKYIAIMSALFSYSVVVVISLVATDMICLHDVSLRYTRVESVHRVEEGAPGQCTWHTWYPYLINRYSIRPLARNPSDLVVCVERSSLPQRRLGQQWTRLSGNL
jgi:hypothetical protein